MITSETPVEEILSDPDLIRYFIKNGVSPFSCSGSFPGSLGKLLEIKKIPDPDRFIEGLNRYLAEKKGVRPE